MAKVTFKDSVRFKELSAPLLWILNILYDLAETAPGIPNEIVITSVNDSKHSVGSRHYTNEAIDIRTHNFRTRETKRWFRGELEKELSRHPLPQSSNKFRVLLEDEGLPNEHLHVQVRKGMRFP
jgi:hypothetical protein